MGDPKRHRKKYMTPSHPWQKARIDEENAVKKAYGMKNKKEIWKMNTVLKDFTFQAKKLIAAKTAQAEKEKKLLLERLLRLGLISQTSKIEDVLGLKLKDIMERRLQTQILRKGFAGTARQARQFIVHGHIFVGSRTITSPSYLLSTAEEGRLSFSVTSALHDAAHPEREAVQGKTRVPVEVKAEEKPEAKPEAKSETKPETKSKPAEAAKKTEAAPKAEVQP